LAKLSQNLALIFLENRSF